jgi:hypothetical protein
MHRWEGEKSLMSNKNAGKGGLGARILAAVAAMSLLAISVWLASGWNSRGRITDCAAYWAASRQLLSGRNPYAAAEVLERERQLGFSGNIPLIMRNPPWAIPVVLPLGSLPYSGGQMLWLWLSLGSVLLSVHVLWRIYGGDSGFGVAGMLTVTFVPVAAVLALGQIGPLMLLGVAGFLHFHQKRGDAWAGVCVTLMALKPHVAFLFWPALLLWAVRQRRWRVLFGLTAGLVAGSGISLALDPAVFRQYLQFWQEGNLTEELIPTLAGLLRLIFGLERRWLELLPVLAATTWFGFHWRRKCPTWDWADEVPILFLVSLVSTPYGWFFDQVILLPAIWQAAGWIMRADAATRMRSAVLYLTVNGLTLALILGHRTTFWYSWTAPAWLLIYLWIFRTQSPRMDDAHAC